MNYGKKIAELRKGKKFTQAELGAKLNISAQAVSKWENNLSEPDLDAIKKMCEIFGITTDEFLGLAPAKPEVQPTVEEETALAESAPQEEIVGYCEKCKKALTEDESRISHWAYNPANGDDKVEETSVQHLYCPTCLSKINKMKKDQDAANLQADIDAQEASYKSENATELKRGLVWGAVITAIMFLCALIAYFSTSDASILTTGLILIIPTYTFSAQMFWLGFISDFFLFFCRSFSAPFGFIFELSLDGIIWLLTVKLAMWIICGMLSIAFFLLGLVLSLMLSVITFPFSLASKIRECK